MLSGSGWLKNSVAVLQARVGSTMLASNPRGNRQIWVGEILPTTLLQINPWLSS